MQTIIEILSFPIIIYLSFWLGIKYLHNVWREPGQNRSDRYGNYFGTWLKRDL